MQGLYVDQDTGKSISTHSMLRTFRRCPKQTEYKYVRRLKLKTKEKPLYRGTWMHELFEAYYSGEDWRAKHEQLTKKFGALFDEEKEILGDLPNECLHMMKSYIWHYKNDPWIVHDTEFVLEAEFPDGTIYRGKIDALVENQFGLWLGDHKTHKTLPNLDFRLKDAQSVLYIWAALKNKINVQGFVWNYIRWKPPTVPTLIKAGTRLARWNQIETDFPTAMAAIKHYGLSTKPYYEKLKYLQSQRFQHGMVQSSPFFKRNYLERDPKVVQRIVQHNYHTSKRMHSYPFDRPEIVEPIVDRSCTFMCSYYHLCTIEQMGGDPRLELKKYKVTDPLDYYYDELEVEEEDGTGR